MSGKNPYTIDSIPIPHKRGREATPGFSTPLGVSSGVNGSCSGMVASGPSRVAMRNELDEGDLVSALATRFAILSAAQRGSGISADGFSSGTPFEQIFNLPVFAAYMVTGLAMLAIFVLSIRFAAGEGLREAAFAALAVSWSNWGYMGFALLPSMLGQDCLAPLIAAGMADLLVLVSTALTDQPLRKKIADMSQPIRPHPTTTTV